MVILSFHAKFGSSLLTVIARSTGTNTCDHRISIILAVFSDCSPSTPWPVTKVKLVSNLISNNTDNPWYENCRCQLDYEQTYVRSRPDKKLRWLPQLGSVNITVELTDRALTLDVTPLQASIIELFTSQGQSNHSPRSRSIYS